MKKTVETSTLMKRHKEDGYTYSRGQICLGGGETIFEGTVGVDDQVWGRDGVELGLQFTVEIEIAILGGMGEVCGVEALAGGRVGADTQNDAPSCAEEIGAGDGGFDLIGAREGAAIEKDMEVGVASEEVRGGFEHQGLAEIILLGGVFDERGREQDAADFIFIEDEALAGGGERTGESTFSGTGETGHEDEHGATGSMVACQE